MTSQSQREELIHKFPSSPSGLFTFLERTFCWDPPNSGTYGTGGRSQRTGRLTRSATLPLGGAGASTVLQAPASKMAMMTMMKMKEMMMTTESPGSLPCRAATCMEQAHILLMCKGTHFHFSGLASTLKGQLGQTALLQKLLFCSGSKALQKRDSPSCSLFFLDPRSPAWCCCIHTSEGCSREGPAPARAV